jgi:hypothetical protein
MPRSGTSSFSASARDALVRQPLGYRSDDAAPTGVTLVEDLFRRLGRKSFQVRETWLPLNRTGDTHG